LGSDPWNKTSILNPEKETLQKRAQNPEPYPHYAIHHFATAQSPLKHLNQCEQ